MEEEKKTVNKSVVILLLVICALSLAAGVYANYRIIVLSNDNKETKEQEKVKDKEEATKEGNEEEVTDQEIINKIDSIKKVIEYKRENLNYTAFLTSTDLYKNKYTSKDFSTSDKLYMVLHSLISDKKYENIEVNDEEEAVNRKYPDGIYNGCAPYTTYTLIDENDVLEEYKRVFNEVPNDMVFESNLFKYDENEKKYFYSGACGTAQTITIENNKYSMDDNHYYVYTRVLELDDSTEDYVMVFDKVDNGIYYNYIK